MSVKNKHPEEHAENDKSEISESENVSKNKKFIKKLELQRIVLQKLVESDRKVNIALDHNEKGRTDADNTLINNKQQPNP
jgi:hypothetical protein